MFRYYKCILVDNSFKYKHTMLILGLRHASEGRRYIVTPSLIGWAQIENQPWHRGGTTKSLTRNPSPIVLCFSQVCDTDR